MPTCSVSNVSLHIKIQNNNYNYKCCNYSVKTCDAVYHWKIDSSLNANKGQKLSVGQERLWWPLCTFLNYKLYLLTYKVQQEMKSQHTSEFSAAYSCSRSNVLTLTFSVQCWIPVSHSLCTSGSSHSVFPMLHNIWCITTDAKVSRTDNFGLSLNLKASVLVSVLVLRRKV